MVGHDQFVGCFVGPEDDGFYDFLGVKEFAHKPEGLTEGEGRGKGSDEFLLGNVKADA